MDKQSKIFVAGHAGMAGSAIVKKLHSEGYENIVGKRSAELDLRNQLAVNKFFEEEKPEFVFLAAAKVGGINANNIYRAEFLYDNLMIEANVIHAAYKHSVKKLMFLGSSCIYPKMALQPLKEEYLLTGSLEDTNIAYAIAKITGIKLCESYRCQYQCNFISGMPANLYGSNDSYDLNNSHVLPSLMRKIIVAKQTNAPFVEIWGSGFPRREFLHANDLADACIYLMKNYNNGEFVNIGTGEDIMIKDLALLIKQIVGYNGELNYDITKPEGTPRKLMDVSKLTAFGWKASISLPEGIKMVFKEIQNYSWN